MKTFSFYNDYSEAAHPELVQATTRIPSDEHLTGYGCDRITEEARARVADACGSGKYAVEFVSGGTQANIILLASVLKPFEAILAPETGHICVHEAGAIEATGHAIVRVPAVDGKVTAEGIQAICTRPVDEHMVRPRVLFVSQPTELGTVYTKEELLLLRDLTKKHKLLLYVDGARLATAVAVGPSLKEVCTAADFLYVGGTKNGGLFGEALVITNPALHADIRWHIKQRGGLLAKGWYLGAQFHRFFDSDGLWYKLGDRAVRSAHLLAEGLTNLNIPFFVPPQTNQLFPILSPELLTHLEEHCGFYRWSQQSDGSWVARFVTSWATAPNTIERFLEYVRAA